MATKKTPTPAQVEEWRGEIATLRAEIAELKKGRGDADVINGITERLAAIEKKLADAPAPAAPAAPAVPLPGGGSAALPAGEHAPAKTTRVAAKQEKKGYGIFE